MRKPEDIMADYLLKGGKMLEKTCPGCGSPLFTVKGETVCVVCAENKPDATGKVPASENVISDNIRSSADNSIEGNCGASVSPATMGSTAGGVYSGGNVRASDNIPGNNDFCSDSLYLDIEETLRELCTRVRNTTNPGDCLVYMDCIKAGTEALNELKK